MRARIFSSHMREKMRGTHMSKFHAPTPLPHCDLDLIRAPQESAIEIKD